mmetsp:Transcript_18043/g.44601  ORF Transcript_18043/g.44601 Transcript_18043/m.44601 type:complete len:139 (+) Transcript_18043:3533-3949(+)
MMLRKDSSHPKAILEDYSCYNKNFESKVSLSLCELKNAKSMLSLPTSHFQYQIYHLQPRMIGELYPCTKSDILLLPPESLFRFFRFSCNRPTSTLAVADLSALTFLVLLAGNFSSSISRIFRFSTDFCLAFDFLTINC